MKLVMMGPFGQIVVNKNGVAVAKPPTTKQLLLTAKTATSFTQRVDGRKIYRDANGGYFILNGFGEPIQTTSTGATLNGGWHKVDHRTLLRLARGSKPAFRRSDGKKVFSDGAGRFFIVAGGEVVFVGKNGFPISTAVIVDRLPSDYWWRSARNSRPEFVRDDEVEVFRGPYGTRYILSARGKPIFVDKTGKALQKGTYPPGFYTTYARITAPAFIRGDLRKVFQSPRGRFFVLGPRGAPIWVNKRGFPIKGKKVTRAMRSDLAIRVGPQFVTSAGVKVYMDNNGNYFRTTPVQKTVNAFGGRINPVTVYSKLGLKWFLRRASTRKAFGTTLKGKKFFKAYWGLFFRIKMARVQWVSSQGRDYDAADYRAAWVINPAKFWRAFRKTAKIFRVRRGGVKVYVGPCNRPVYFRRRAPNTPIYLDGKGQKLAPGSVFYPKGFHVCLARYSRPYFIAETGAEVFMDDNGRFFLVSKGKAIFTSADGTRLRVQPYFVGLFRAFQSPTGAMVQALRRKMLKLKKRIFGGRARKATRRGRGRGGLFRARRPSCTCRKVSCRCPNGKKGKNCRRNCRKQAAAYKTCQKKCRASRRGSRGAGRLLRGAVRIGKRVVRKIAKFAKRVGRLVSRKARRIGKRFVKRVKKLYRGAKRKVKRTVKCLKKGCRKGRKLAKKAKKAMKKVLKRVKGLFKRGKKTVKKINKKAVFKCKATIKARCINNVNSAASAASKICKRSTKSKKSKRCKSALRALKRAKRSCKKVVSRCTKKVKKLVKKVNRKIKNIKKKVHFKSRGQAKKERKAAAHAAKKARKVRKARKAYKKAAKKAIKKALKKAAKKAAKRAYRAARANGLSKKLAKKLAKRVAKKLAKKNRKNGIPVTAPTQVELDQMLVRKLLKVHAKIAGIPTVTKAQLKEASVHLVKARRIRNGVYNSMIKACNSPICKLAEKLAAKRV